MWPSAAWEIQILGQARDAAQSRCCLYFNPPGDVSNSQLAPQGKAPSDFVLHHAGASGRTERRTHSAWDGGKKHETPSESLVKPTSARRALHCCSCANIQHPTGYRPPPHAMGTSTLSKAPAPSPGHLWRLWCTGGEHAPSRGRKASARRGDVHAANWHSPPRCFGA